MKVTHNAGSDIPDSSDFQNFPGVHATGPPSSVHFRNSNFLQTAPHESPVTVL